VFHFVGMDQCSSVLLSRLLMTPWNLRVTLTAMSMASFETLRPSALTAIEPAVERERIQRLSADSTRQVVSVHKKLQKS
jgi:hypothetical protein